MMKIFFRFFLIIAIVSSSKIVFGQVFPVDQLVPGQSDILLANDNFASQKRLAVDVDNLSKKKVFVWQELDPGSSGNRNIRCEVYSESMTLIHSFIVNSTTEGDQLYPSVKVSQTDNSFVVAWSGWINNTNTSDPNKYDIYAKKISFSNIAVDAANPDLLINGSSTDPTQVNGRQIVPLIAFDYFQKEAIIAWVDQDGKDNNTPNVVDCGSYARRVKTMGSSLALIPIAPVFSINAITAGHQTINSIQIDQTTGALYTVCHSMGYSSATTYDIIFRKFSRGGDGNFMGQGEVTVNKELTGNQIYPYLVLNSLNGNYAICWTSESQDGSGRGSYFRVFDKNGYTLKNETRININVANNQLTPKLIWEENSGTFVFFYWYSQTGTVNIRYQLFDENYNYVGTEVVAESPNLQNYYAGIYSVAYEKSGRRLLLAYDQFQSSSGANSKGWFRELVFITPCPTDLTSNQNYVETRTITREGVFNAADCSTLSESLLSARTYFDGLGRPIQEVMVKGSPGKKDLVQPISYDEAGRKAKSFLPYVSNCGDGTYKSHWESDQSFFYSNNANNNEDRIVNDANPFSVSIFDNSPLNKVVKVLPQGAAWQTGTADHSIRTTTRANTANEVRNWLFDYTALTASGTAYYEAGELLVLETTDEDDNKMWQYIDKMQRIVLKKGQDKNTGAFLETFYVYDDLGKLRFVIPPQATSLLAGADQTVGYTDDFSNDWIFSYKYDSRGRVTEKKIPGSEPEYFIYDHNDRVVLTQDGNQRSLKQWSYTKYDIFHRVLVTGIYTHSASVTQAEMQSLFASNNPVITSEIRQASTLHGYSNRVWPDDAALSEVLTVNYYDDYDFDYNTIADHSYKPQGLSGETGVNNSVKTLPTGTKVKILGSASDWIRTVTFYDKNYRPVQVQKNNHKNLSVLSDLQTNVYSFTGKILLTYASHDPGNSPVNITNKYSYDHADRLQKTWQQINTDAEVLLGQVNYNELGQSVEKNLHSENGGATFLQSVDFIYHIRGWLTHINNSTLSNDGFTNNDANDLFGMQLSYESTSTGGTAKFNGSITEQKWRGANTRTSTIENAWKYDYDGVNNLMAATMATFSNGVWTGNNNFKEESIRYDLNGNITSLNRTGAAGAYLDKLTYSYKGNRLVSVIDSADISAGFKDGSAGQVDYNYDSNGNLTSDLNKGLDFQYNYLNLVHQVQSVSNNDKIIYTYSADGVRLKKTIYNNDGSMQRSWDYIGAFVYEDNVISYIATGEGRARYNGTSYSYEYDLKDHLGNVRMTFDKGADGKAHIVQEDHYYAFGMTLASNQYSYHPVAANKLLYNSKEKQEELGLEWYDFGARMYDPQLGRWHSVDPLAEKSRRWSPYTYCYDNPLSFIDPDGMQAFPGDIGSEGDRGWLNTRTEDTWNLDNLWNIPEEEKEIFPVDQGGRVIISSTHTDKYGNVVAVYDDGDLGVYQHEDLSDWDGKSTLPSSGDGVTNMGETAYWDEFINPGSKKPEGTIVFNTSWEKLIKWGNDLARKQDLKLTMQDSKNGHPLDIKENKGWAPAGTMTGRLLNGKYATARSAGNYLAGMNGVTGTIEGKYISGETYMKLAGAYQQKKLTGLNITRILTFGTSFGPAPYYGEEPYSGRRIAEGIEEGLKTR